MEQETKDALLKIFIEEFPETQKVSLLSESITGYRNRESIQEQRYVLEHIYNIIAHTTDREEIQVENIRMCFLSSQLLSYQQLMLYIVNNHSQDELNCIIKDKYSLLMDLTKMVDRFIGINERHLRLDQYRTNIGDLHATKEELKKYVTLLLKHYCPNDIKEELRLILNTTPQRVETKPEIVNYSINHLCEIMTEYYPETNAVVSFVESMFRRNLLYPSAEMRDVLHHIMHSFTSEGEEHSKSELDNAAEHFRRSAVESFQMLTEEVKNTLEIPYLYHPSVQHLVEYECPIYAALSRYHKARKSWRKAIEYNSMFLNALNKRVRDEGGILLRFSSYDK